MALYPKRKLRRLLKNGEYAKAIELGKSLESKFADDSDFMFIMGSVYFIVNESEKALPYFERSHELNNTDLDTLHLKTNVHLALKQKDAAIQCVEQILELDPKNDEAIILLEDLHNT